MISARLGEINRLMRSSFSTRLQDMGLYGGQERIILALKQDDGLAPGELASRLGVSAPTIAKSINRLSANGFIVRRKDKKDGRRAKIYLTNLGHSMVKSIQKEQRKWQRSVFKGFTTADKKKILKDLEKVVENIDKID